MFALYALYRLGLGAKETGYVLAYVGLLVVLVQGVAIGWMAARFPERWWRRAVRLLAIRIPAYQAVAVGVCLIGLWLVVGTTPAGPVRPSAIEPVPAAPAGDAT